MFQVLRFRSDSSYAVINAALTLDPARVMALVFPAGVRPYITESGQLDALYVRARSIGKDITIVGGDAGLRVMAVAAGFAAAATLDDWRQAKRNSGVHRKRFSDEQAPLQMLTDQQDPNSSGGSWTAEPPQHIASLLEARESQCRVTPPTRQLTEAEMDVRDAEAILQASERYEEEVTARIRATSDLDISWAI